MNFRQRLATFMYGRYGRDQLGIALLVLYVIFFLINSFLGSRIIGTLEFLICMYALYRMLSRNIYKRQMENAKFLKLWSRVYPSFSNVGRRFRDIKTNRYRKCKYCKKTLRLPIKTGKHTVICPCCKNKITVRILF